MEGQVRKAGSASRTSQQPASSGPGSPCLPQRPKVVEKVDVTTYLPPACRAKGDLPGALRSRRACSCGDGPPCRTPADGMRSTGSCPRGGRGPGPFPGKHLALVLGARCQRRFSEGQWEAEVRPGSGVTCSAHYAISLLSIMGLSIYEARSSEPEANWAENMPLLRPEEGEGSQLSSNGPTQRPSPHTPGLRCRLQNSARITAHGVPGATAWYVLRLCCWNFPFKTLFNSLSF